MLELLARLQAVIREATSSQSPLTREEVFTRWQNEPPQVVDIDDTDEA